MNQRPGYHNASEATPKLSRRGGIFIRTVLLSWILIIITLIIFILAIIPYQRSELQNEMRIQAQVAFSSVSQVLENAILLEDFSTIVDHSLALISKNPRLLYIVIARHDGFSLIHTPSRWSQETRRGIWLPAKTDKRNSGYFRMSRVVGQEVYHVSFPFQYSGINWGWIHVGLSPAKYYLDLKSLYIRISLTFILALSIGMALSLSFARRISRPIQVLERAAKRIQNGDLSARADIASGDEVESLSNTFNRMAGHLNTVITEKEKEIRERKEAEAALRQSEERYRTIIERIEDGYYEVDLFGNLLFCNEMMRKILGYSVTELVGMNCADLIDEANRKKTFRRFARVYLAHQPVSVLGMEIKRKDGRLRQIETSVALIRDGAGKTTGFRGVARDVDERKKQEAHLIYIAYHDMLTGLKNRKWFYEKLEERLVHARRYRYEIALLYIDIDHFKQVNDEQGHESGDRLLQIIAKRLKLCLRRADAIARIGGDEFSVILDNPTEAVSPETVAGKVVEQVGRPYSMAGGTISYVSASIGVSRLSTTDGDPESLVKWADQAMYRAKLKGGCYVVHQSDGSFSSPATASRL